MKITIEIELSEPNRISNATSVQEKRRLLNNVLGVVSSELKNCVNQEPFNFDDKTPAFKFPYHAYGNDMNVSLSISNEDN